MFVSHDRGIFSAIASSVVSTCAGRQATHALIRYASSPSQGGVPGSTKVWETFMEQLGLELAHLEARSRGTELEPTLTTDPETIVFPSFTHQHLSFPRPASTRAFPKRPALVLFCVVGVTARRPPASLPSCRRKLDDLRSRCPRSRTRRQRLVQHPLSALRHRRLLFPLPPSVVNMADGAAAPTRAHSMYSSLAPQSLPTAVDLRQDLALTSARRKTRHLVSPPLPQPHFVVAHHLLFRGSVTRTGALVRGLPNGC